MSYADGSSYVARSSRKRGWTPGAVLRPKGLGDAQDAELGSVTGALTRLAAYAKRDKTALSPAAAQDFRSVTTAVTLLRGTEHYARLKQAILRSFPNKPYDVGTVGAYFVNCTDPAARDACAAPCVGNLVLDDGTEDACPVRVFALKFEGAATRTLLALNDPPESSRAIVYIYLDGSRRLGGLTASEIESLANLGVRDVHVFYYDPATYEQVPLTPSFVPVGTLEPLPRSPGESGADFWAILLIIVALIIVALIVWRAYAK